MDMHGYQQYKAQSINTMTPGELLMLLYDELIKRLARAEIALKNQNYEVFDESIIRCREILRYLAMRQEPVLRMQELDGNIRRIVEIDAPDIEARWRALVRGDNPQNADEQMIVNQMQQNKRVIERLVPIDSRISQVLSERKS